LLPSKKKLLQLCGKQQLGTDSLLNVPDRHTAVT